MRLASMHTHTLFCDGKDDIETMCRAAHARGLYAIGFSSHAPVFRHTGFKTDWHMSDEKLNEYAGEVLAARSRWHGKLAVFLGLELDYIKGLRSAMDSDIKAFNSDFIIGSIHYVVPPNGAQPFTVDGPQEEFENGIREGFGGDLEAFLQCYWTAMAEMVALGGIDIIGHIDLVKKNLLGLYAERDFLIAAEIARTAACAGVAVEVNTGGLNRAYINETCPSAFLLRIFNEHKVPAIITADAHRAADINGNYDIARQTLIEAGYTEHALFSGKQNGKPTWHIEKLI
ncbi:MAG: histidinol-phosphatase [Treponema sp.]|nr:histidinol-phosphatase [Treponema sp.]